ncbi:MAG TPA: fibronectin type III domain-containing protein, partial [Elusimicrobiota bacterium]|nr:fibronectin type III domain-containing protein [Elusimicrobiota bacterium]
MCLACWSGLASAVKLTWGNVTQLAGKPGWFITARNGNTSSIRPGLDVRGADTLSFMVKRDALSGAADFLVGVKDWGPNGSLNDGDEIEKKVSIGPYISGGVVDTEYRQVQIPLSVLTNPQVHTEKLETINIEPLTAAATIYVDNFVFLDSVSPSAPTNMQDDGGVVANDHVFNATNTLTVQAAAGSTDKTLESVRVEYSTDSGTTWSTIGRDYDVTDDTYTFTWYTTALSTSATYYVRAVSEDASGNMGLMAAFTDCDVDWKTAAPGSFAAAAQSSTSVRFDWLLALGATAYQVQTATAGLIAELPDPTSYYIQTDLTANTSSQITRVQSFNAGGGGGFTVLADSPVFTLANVPLGVEVAGVYGSSVALNWTANDNRVGTRFEVSQSTDEFALDFSTPVPLASNYAVYSATVTGLLPGTTYWFRLRAFNDDDIASVFSSTVSTSTLGGPAAPGNFRATASSLTVRWDWDLSTGATAYFLLSSTNGILAALNDPTSYYVQTKDILGNDLQPNTSSYITNIQASNGYGVSDYSYVTSSPVYTLANAPNNLTVMGVHYTTVTLQWTPSGNQSGTPYEISMSTVDSGFTSGVSTPVPFAQNLTGMTTTLASLSPGATYYFRVRAKNGDDVVSEGFSPVASTTTLSFGVVINEIAWGGTAAGSSDEWVELYNSGSGSVDLAGCSLVIQATTIPLSGVLGAGQYYLLERTDDSTVSDIAADWFGSFGGSGIPNTGGALTLYISSTNGIVADSVSFAGSWPAGSATPNYYTMERVSATVSGSQSSNWASNNGVTRNGLDAGSNPLNGTPKALNSTTPDSWPPSAISDLTALSGANDGEISLSWTSPGDNGVTGDISGGQFVITYTTVGIINDFNAPPTPVTMRAITPLSGSRA